MATLHAKISYLKSAVRIAGYLALLMISPAAIVPAIILVGSEVIGIVEEIGH